ncbi:hypothetical protein M5K25_001525 [Dendrobium thyrsiflorum]|uniref:Uncharacterized protein n=1 Tax=Dendrobium thyrsiflorum TaxID=117978 RepID=A0ABD0VR59_DENTH
MGRLFYADTGRENRPVYAEYRAVLGEKLTIPEVKLPNVQTLHPQLRHQRGRGCSSLLPPRSQRHLWPLGSRSIERLDILDEDQRVTGFSIIGGERRLRNYRSVRTVTKFGGSDREEGCDEWTVVLESYIVDVPEGNTEDDTRLFADTVVRLNLQKLASVSESLAAAAGMPEKGK